MSLLGIVDTDIKKWEYLYEFISEFDYHKIITDYRKCDNIVGHQQRAISIYWAIKEHQRTEGIGLDIGCGPYTSPFCIGIDNYTGNEHPYCKWACYPHVKCTGEILPFKKDIFDFIVANHTLEHMKNTENTLREWLRVMKSGGKIVIVMPDKKYGPFGDPGHVSECSPQEFSEVLRKIENIKIIEHNTLYNNFSFNTVIEKCRS